MQFDCFFGSSVFGSIKHVQAEGQETCIETQQRVLKPKFVFPVKLAKNHRYKLIPTVEALDPFRRMRLSYKGFKLQLLEKGYNLSEKAIIFVHEMSLLFGFSFSPKENEKMNRSISYFRNYYIQVS